MISNLTGKSIHRSTSAEMSAFGAAFMAGLDAGNTYEFRDRKKKVIFLRQKKLFLGDPKMQNK